MKQPQSVNLFVFLSLTSAGDLVSVKKKKKLKKLAKDLNIISYFISLNLLKLPYERNTNPDIRTS